MRNCLLEMYTQSALQGDEWVDTITSFGGLVMILLFFQFKRSTSIPSGTDLPGQLHLSNTDGDIQPDPRTNEAEASVQYTNLPPAHVTSDRAGPDTPIRSLCVFRHFGGGF